MKASKKTKSLSNPAEVKDGYNLPSHDALAQILPNGRYLFKGANPRLQRAAQREPERPEAKQPNINHTYHIHRPHQRPPLHTDEDDHRMAEITNLQTKEVENYRSAMGKMAEDIIALRTQMVRLEAENSQLRSALSLQQDLGKDLLDDIHAMTRAEIANYIASLKFKLANETSKAASQRDRIQNLQNDLIKENDSEKELLKLQRVLQQQQEDLQRCHSRLAKMANLEATVKHQEKVIEKMEKALDSKLIEKSKQTGDRRPLVNRQKGGTDNRKEEIESARAAENSRLRGELDRIHRQPAPVIKQQSAQRKEALPVEERINLERAEARVQTLEAQLEENSNLWGREKQEMLTKLSEHRHGFVRTSTTILNNVPSRSVPESLSEQSRQRKQKKSC
ncbi:coiled-coil domain-containing protein 33 [Pseudochaenichthys georgianus]|uniref:coiled-coil domain-containing protein 33 n=1 Tax=Pseudochaenichthys georgianus TaxID=52239 RepID=UPI00146AB35E|nr:coiled-coil domain-containing protein 33 [Pseudochaenichthys georgianus]XP_033940920.1 coiled-coil domain-containing protein 33 [Pseudochaenichthys georgianus]XP_033940921.1 coiled-coil domain-containing protein 33 [Pseudochaenichthys georgianus]